MTREPISETDRLLKGSEVARMFRVDGKTVTRWGKAGKIGRIRTPGGHWLYSASEVASFFEGDHDDHED
jgi:predicted site-specific integrase-resolvase